MLKRMKNREVAKVMDAWKEVTAWESRMRELGRVAILKAQHSLKIYTFQKWSARVGLLLACKGLLDRTQKEDKRIRFRQWKQNAHRQAQLRGAAYAVRARYNRRTLRSNMTKWLLSWRVCFFAKSWARTRAIKALRMNSRRSIAQKRLLEKSFRFFSGGLSRRVFSGWREQAAYERQERLQALKWREEMLLERRVRWAAEMHYRRKERRQVKKIVVAGRTITVRSCKIRAGCAKLEELFYVSIQMRSM